MEKILLVKRHRAYKTKSFVSINHVAHTIVAKVVACYCEIIMKTLKRTYKKNCCFFSVLQRLELEFNFFSFNKSHKDDQKAFFDQVAHNQFLALSTRTYQNLLFCRKSFTFQKV